MSTLHRLFAQFEQAVIQLPFRLLPSQGDASWAVTLGGSPPDMKTAPDKDGYQSIGKDGAIAAFDPVTGKWVEVTAAASLPGVKGKKAKFYKKQVNEDELTQLLAELVETDEDEDANNDFVAFAEEDKPSSEDQEDAGFDDFLDDL